MMSRAVGSFSELDFDGFEVRRVPSRPSAIGVTRAAWRVRCGVAETVTALADAG